MSDFTKQLNVYWKINWIRRSLIAAAIILLILVLIPFGIQYGISQQLEKMGASQVSIDDIDFNPFAGRFEINSLSYQVDDASPARVDQLLADIHMLQLFQGRVVIDQVKLTGLLCAINRKDDGNIEVNGLTVFDASAPAVEAPDDDQTPQHSDDGVKFAVNQLSLEAVTVDYQETDFRQLVKIDELRIEGVQSWNTNSTARLTINNSINNATLNADLDLKLFTETPQISGTLALQQVNLEDYRKFYQPHLTALNGKVGIELDFDVQLSEAPQGHINHKLTLDQLMAHYPPLQQKIESLIWQGQADLAGLDNLNVNGNLAIKNSETRDKQQDYPINSFESLSISALDYRKEAVKFEQLILDQLVLLHPQEENQLIQLKQLETANLSFNVAESALNIDSVKLMKPVINVKIDEKQQLVHLQPLLASIDQLAGPKQDTGEVNKPEKSAESKPLALLVKQIRLTEPGQLEFIDHSVAPNFKTQMAFNQIEIDNLSSDEAADFKIDLKQGEYNQINFSGSGKLMDPTNQLELMGKISQLDLPPITPYSSKAMGYGLKSGVLDSDIKLSMKEKIIDSTIDLKLDSVEVVETNTDTAEQISSASGMSIDLAVSTLKDDNDIIELEIPVKGDIENPDFDLSLVINQAMGKAMKSASLAYLKHTLQPFGSLITLFNLVKSAANHISLPPLVFQPNSVELADGQQELLEKVNTLLNERPNLKIKACAISSLPDQKIIEQNLIKAAMEERKKQAGKEKAEEAEKSDAANADGETVQISIAPEIVQQQMKDLADQRSSKVKAYFLEKGNLPSSRILNCLSTNNLEQDSQPVVELSI